MFQTCYANKSFLLRKSVSIFEFWLFYIASNFGFRYSNFKKLIESTSLFNGINLYLDRQFFLMCSNHRFAMQGCKQEIIQGLLFLFSANKGRHIGPLGSHGRNNKVHLLR